MSGVYFKDMEMPDRCFACPLCTVEVDDWSCAKSRGSYIEYREIDIDTALDARPGWCPLIPVPDHGRLVDADALLKGCERVEGEFATREYAFSQTAIANAPTIIPADPADKEGEG